MDINFTKNPPIGQQVRIKSPRNTLFEATLLIIVCLLFGWFIVLPKKAQLQNRQADVAKAKEEENQISGKLAVLRKLAADLNAHQADVADLDRALPLDGKTINLRLLLDALGKQAGVTVGDISLPGLTGVVAGDKALLANPFGASRSLKKLGGSAYVIGSLNQLVAFLQKIETSGRLIDISSVNINPGVEGALTLNISFDAYYFAP